MEIIISKPILRTELCLKSQFLAKNENIPKRPKIDRNKARSRRQNEKII